MAGLAVCGGLVDTAGRVAFGIRPVGGPLKREARRAKAASGTRARWPASPCLFRRRIADNGAMTVRLNKHIAETGFCSRREADRLIFERRVTVNGQQITRVRIGPFTSRKQMEQAAAKVRALGLPVSMYQL